MMMNDDYRDYGLHIIILHTGAYGSWIMDFTWNFLLFNGEMMMSLVSIRCVTCDRSCDKIMKMPEEEKPVV
jgi:hypothetical protein